VHRPRAHGVAGARFDWRASGPQPTPTFWMAPKEGRAPFLEIATSASQLLAGDADRRLFDAPYIPSGTRSGPPRRTSAPERNGRGVGQWGQKTGHRAGFIKAVRYQKYLRRTEFTSGMVSDRRRRE